MKTNIFILIVAVYGLVLGITAVFYPSASLRYFNGEPENLMQQSIMNSLGLSQIALSYLGISATKSTDSIFRKAFLLSLAFLTFFSVGVSLFNLNMRHFTASSTYLADIAIWLIIAAAALYFRSKE
jgi:hypothetical protein